MRLNWALVLALAAVGTSSAAAQTISSAANQTFGLGNGTTTISTITITDAGTPTITSANDIRIRIPTGFSMMWNTGDATATLSGSAAGKVSTNVTYESGNRVLRLNVTANFVAGDQLIVSGLQFENFTAASAADNLELVVSGSSAGPTVATDDKTVTIVVPSVSSAANQTFVVADPGTAMSAITVAEAGAATITAANDIRIRIPAGFNMIWNTGLTTATISGSAAGKVSTTVTYESGGQVLRLNVSANFVASDQITVSGLQFTSFTAGSAAAGLELVISGGSGGATVATDDKTKMIVAVALTEAANQVFTVADPATAMIVATVTDAAAPRITTANGIRLRIPAALNMIWNTSIATATIGGPAAAKVTGSVSYEDAGKTAFLGVSSAFTAGDQVTISGLQFTNFTAVSAATSLQLVTSGSGGATSATSNQTKQIVRPAIASGASQTFTVGDPAVGISPVTITDAAVPTIVAMDDIRVRIPTGFSMTWNTSLTTATIGGSGAAKVSTAVAYEDGGQTLVLNVTSDFAAGDQITVSGLQYTSFTASSAADNLSLIVSGPSGNAAASDFRTIQIYQPMSVSSAVSQTFVAGGLTTNISAITVTEDGTPTITAANDLRVRIPAGFNMTWNNGDGTATLSGSAAGKVSTSVTYEAGSQVLRLNVTSNFAAGDQLIISGLQFENFTGPSPAANLELVVSGSAGGPIAGTDDQTVTIVAPSISGLADQTFAVANPATAMAGVTVTDNATSATITAVNNIRVRIPAGFNMTWNTAVTTATITGPAAGKVATAVTYANGNRDLVLNVTADFAAGEAIVVSGLQYTSFTAVSAADNLELVVAGAAGGTAATDDKTIAIVAPTLTGSSNQVFALGDPATAMVPLTITVPAAATITAANDLRIRIPAGFDMTWNTSVTTVVLTGSAAGKVSSTVSYENGGLVLVLDVTSNFMAGDDLGLSALEFTNFTAVSGADNLELVISGPGGGATSTDNTTKRIVAPTLSSAASQTFGVLNAATAMSTITITDATAATITVANDIRIRIPAGFNMTWNTSLTTATIGGSDAAKVSTTVSYENGGQILVLNVTTSFVASDQITVAGLQFTNFTAASAAANLELVISGSSSGGTTDTDNRTKTIVAPTLSSAANQSFVVGGTATAMSTITITDVNPATITAANDIRIRIPAGFNMTWNTSLVTATIGGTDAGKVSTGVSYENSGRVLVLNVTTTFAANDQITISGLQFTGFTGTSAPANLELVISGSSSGSAAGADNRTKTVIAPSISSAANQTFAAGGAAMAMSTITITEAGAATITAANDIRIRIPAGFNMTWNTGLTTATVGGSDAAKVSTTVSYENSGRVLVLNVTTSFAASDQITVSGLQFSNFTAASAVDSLVLEVSNNGLTTALDNRTIQITAVYSVSATPDVVPVSQLPSNGTNYTMNFTVGNPGTGSDSYDLLTATPLTAITVVSIAGTGITQGANPDSARLAALAPGASQIITVTYTVGSVAAGATDTLILTVRSVGNPAVADDARLELTVIRPAVSLLKGVSPNGIQPPGTDLTYSLTLSNSGSAAAGGIVAVDTLSSFVMLKVGSEVNNLPPGVAVSLAYSNDGGSTWAYVPASQACGAPAGFDACVNRIRWTLLNNLVSVAPDNSGTVEFISRIK